MNLPLRRTVLFLLRGLALVLLLAGHAAGARASTLMAPDEIWSRLQWWPQAPAEASLDAVLHHGQGFEPAAARLPRFNFGVRREPLWLRFPVEPGGSDIGAVLRIDYPPLNRVDVWRVADGQVLQHQVLGNAQPFSARPLPSRTHAMAMTLVPGRAEMVYLRVESTSSVLLPMALMTPEAFWAEESSMQMLHGLMAGLSLALLLYALAHWVSVRDPLFLSYAAILVGVGVFFVAYFGLGQQHLWSTQEGLLGKVAPLSVMVALIGGAFFVRNVLSAQQPQSLLYRLQTAVAACAALAMAASLAGLLDYRQTQLAATVLGPMPMLLALPVGVRRARAGDREARLLTAGWVAYTIGALSMAGLLRGVVPAGFWTQHLFQFSTLLEMVLWVRVLGLRIELIRRDAERNVLEKQALLSLAHTDALTGLPNRRGLNQALDQALALVRPDQALAVFLLDLDGFKPVNDRLGHDAGDELLVKVGARLKANLRGSDVVARLGGDEFVIMASGVSSEADAQRLGDKLLRAFDEPFALAQAQTCRVGLTIGFALAPHDGREAADLLKRADAAMYAGKQAGRHCVRRGAASASLASPA